MRMSPAATAIDRRARLDLEQQRGRCRIAGRCARRSGASAAADVERLGEMGDLRLGRAREQRLVRPERVEAEAQARAVGVDERHAREPERLHAPEEDADVRDVVAARPRAAMRRISAVCAKSSNAPAWKAPASSSRAASRRSAVAAACGRTWFMYCVVASSSKNSTACAGQPVTSAGELLEHRHGALAPAVADRVRDVGARRGELRHDAVQRAVADEVADVRRDPRRARLDELVVVHLLEALREDVHLLGERRRRARAARRPARRRARGRRPAAAGRSPPSCRGPMPLTSSASSSVERRGVEDEHACRDRRAARADGGALREQPLVERRRRARVEPVDVDREHARDRVRDRVDPRAEHRLAEVARVERVRRAQRRLDARRARRRPRTRGRRRPSARAGTSASCPRARAPRRAGRRACAAPSRDRRAGRRPSNATVTTTVRPARSCSTRGVRLHDAGERAREVLVVEQRDRAAERAHAERDRRARRVLRLGIDAAARRPRDCSRPSRRAAGRSAARARRASRCRPRRVPLRYFARTLFEPDGSRAPRSPSPNCTYVLPSSSVRTTYARSRRRPPRTASRSSSQRTSLTRTSSAACAPDGSDVDCTYVSGSCASVKRWNAGAARPEPSSCCTVSPCVASATLPWTTTVSRS